MNTPAFDTYEDNNEDLYQLFWVLSDALMTTKPERDKEFNRVIRTLDFTMHWLIVMEVTFVETYLEDALAFCAKLSPPLMKESEQNVEYGRAREAGSLDELLEEMRHGWARNWVDNGGPGRWIDRLKRMGARGYETKLGSRLETMWGMRHIIVHSAGKIDHEFCRRHGSEFGDPGDQLEVPPDLINDYVKSCVTFVNTTEQYFRQRFLE